MPNWLQSEALKIGESCWCLLARLLKSVSVFLNPILAGPQAIHVCSLPALSQCLPIRLNQTFQNPEFCMTGTDGLDKHWSALPQLDETWYILQWILQRGQQWCFLSGKLLLPPTFAQLVCPPTEKLTYCLLAAGLSRTDVCGEAWG